MDAPRDLAFSPMKVDEGVESVGAEDGAVGPAQEGVDGGVHVSHLPPHVLQLGFFKECFQPGLQQIVQHCGSKFPALMYSFVGVHYPLK